MRTQDEKQAANEIVIENRFLKWLDNFWYHYKWTVIVVGFFLLVGIVCFAQCSTKATGDITVTFAGGYTLTQEERTNIVDVLDAVSPQKPDGSGQYSSLLADYSVYTEEEMRALCTNEDGEFSASAYNNLKQVSLDHLKTFGTYVMTGECGIWLVSEYVYGAQNLSTLAVPLSELYETVPESAYDDYAVRLADTELYQYYDALKVLPEDTLIVMSQKFVMGAISDEEAYAEALSMYRAIVDFKMP